MPTALAVDPRFCGPPEIANGGYLAGLLARGIEGPVEVSLRAPAPLATALSVETDGRGARALFHAGRELARAAPAELRLELRPALASGEIAARAGGCRAMRTHPFPGCFVCGPDRAAGDGLRIFPGTVEGSDAVAALWTPDRTHCDPRGRVAPELIWAALDCPSAFPLLESEASRALEPMVLAKLCVELTGGLACGETARLVAWPIAQEGRRGTAGAALYGEEGNLVGRARATWISLAGRA